MAYDFSENVQRGILYLLKDNPEFFLEIINLVQPDYFEFPSHSKIFSAVRDHHENYGKLPSDSVLIEAIRKDLGPKENISDYQDELDYVNSVDASTLENKDFLLDLVEKFAKKEAMKAAIADSIQLVKDERMDEVELLVRNALLVSRDINVGLEYYTSVADRWDRAFNTEQVRKFKTLFPSINKSLEGGLGPKELAMVVAPPGVGKSLYLVNQGVSCMMQNMKVLYVSLEMSEDKIANRFDSVMTLVPQRKLKDPANQITVKQRLEMFKEKFPGSDLVIKEFPTGTASSNTIRNLLGQLKNYNDFVPDVLIVDYLELLRPVREIQAEYLAQQRIAEELRGIGVENDMLVWTATQTNRQGSGIKIITDKELGDSYGKIRTVDLAISLNQTEEEFDEGRMRAYVMKARDGRARFTIPMSIDYGTLGMEELDSNLTEG